MKFGLGDTELSELIERVVETTMARLSAKHAQLDGRLSFTEGESAGLLGVPRHTLRDARLRGDINATRVGRRVVYTREELIAYLERNRV